MANKEKVIKKQEKLVLPISVGFVPEKRGRKKSEKSFPKFSWHKDKPSQKWNLECKISTH